MVGGFIRRPGVIGIVPVHWGRTWTQVSPYAFLDYPDFSVCEETYPSRSVRRPRGFVSTVFVGMICKYLLESHPHLQDTGVSITFIFDYLYLISL